jgi:hypothetical protein
MVIIMKQLLSEKQPLKLTSLILKYLHAGNNIKSNYLITYLNIIPPKSQRQADLKCKQNEQNQNILKNYNP